MSEYTFKIDKNLLVSSESFTEASKEELRVLVAIMCTNAAVSIEQLAASAGVSVPRTKAAITLFEECGIITKNDESGFVKSFPTNEGKRGTLLQFVGMKSAKSLDKAVTVVYNGLNKLFGGTYGIGQTKMAGHDRACKGETVPLVADAHFHL